MDLMLDVYNESCLQGTDHAVGLEEMINNVKDQKIKLEKEVQKWCQERGYEGPETRSISDKDEHEGQSVSTHFTHHFLHDHRASKEEEMLTQSSLIDLALS